MPLIFCGLVLFLTSGSPAAAADLLSVGRSQAEIVAAPHNARAPVVLVAPRHYPLLVVTPGDPCEVEDFRGRRGWLPRAALAEQPAVVVAVPLANLRGGPGLKHPVLFQAREGVAFRVLQRSGDWLRVRHGGGLEGWLFRGLAWGRTDGP